MIIREGQIYLIQNNITNKCYVGQTVTHRYSRGKLYSFGYKTRFIEHCTKKNQTCYLEKSIKKYGTSNFTVKLLLTCKLNELNYYEIKYIKDLDTLYPNGYNATSGGDSYNPSEIIKNKISDSVKKYYNNSKRKKYHSKIHINKFKDIPKNNIENIEISQIYENNKKKIVYMYIKYFGNKERLRRRYGGIHINFQDSLERCKKDALNILNYDETKLKIILNKNERDDINFIKKMNNNGGKIIQIEIKKHKMKDKMLTSIYIKTNNMIKWNEKLRRVFGGKTVSFDESYNQALNFVKKIKKDYTKVINYIAL